MLNGITSFMYGYKESQIVQIKLLDKICQEISKNEKSGKYSFNFYSDESIINVATKQILMLYGYTIIEIDKSYGKFRVVNIWSLKND